MTLRLVALITSTKRRNGCNRNSKTTGSTARPTGASETSDRGERPDDRNDRPERPRRPKQPTRTTEESYWRPFRTSNRSMPVFQTYKIHLGNACFRVLIGSNDRNERPARPKRMTGTTEAVPRLFWRHLGALFGPQIGLFRCSKSTKSVGKMCVFEF